MKHYSIYVIFAAIGFIPVLSVGQDRDPFAENRSKWNQRLEDASQWLIQYGLHFHSENGVDHFNRHLRSELLVSPYIPSYTDESDNFTAFGITLGGSYFDVSCFYRERRDGKLYELWTIQTSFDPVSKVHNYTKFAFSSADSFYGTREIEHISNSLEKEFKFRDGFTLSIPKDDSLVRAKILNVMDSQRNRNTGMPNK